MEKCLAAVQKSTQASAAGANIALVKFPIYHEKLLSSDG